MVGDHPGVSCRGRQNGDWRLERNRGSFQRLNTFPMPGEFAQFEKTNGIRRIPRKNISKHRHTLQRSPPECVFSALLGGAPHPRRPAGPAGPPVLPHPSARPRSSGRSTALDPSSIRGSTPSSRGTLAPTFKRYSSARAARGSGKGWMLRLEAGRHALVRNWSGKKGETRKRTEPDPEGQGQGPHFTGSGHIYLDLPTVTNFSLFIYKIIKPAKGRHFAYVEDPGRYIYIYITSAVFSAGAK